MLQLFTSYPSLIELFRFSVIEPLSVLLCSYTSFVEWELAFNILKHKMISNHKPIPRVQRLKTAKPYFKLKKIWTDIKGFTDFSYDNACRRIIQNQIDGQEKCDQKRLKGYKKRKSKRTTKKKNWNK